MNQHIKSLLLTGLFFASLLWLASGCNVRFNHLDSYSFTYMGSQATRSESDQFATDIEKLTIENRFGNVSVQLAEDQPRWEWTIKCWSNSPEAAAMLTHEVKLDRSQQGREATFRLSLPEPSLSFNGAESTLIVFVSADTEIQISNTHGNTNVADVARPVALTNRHGNVSVNNVASATTIRSQHGTVNCESVADVDVENSHGSVVVNQSTGDVRVVGKHSPINLQRVAGKVSVNSAHASLTIDDISETVNFNVSHGNIKLSQVRGDLDGQLAHSNLVGNTGSSQVKLHGRHCRISLDHVNHDVKMIEIASTFGDINLRLPQDSRVAITQDLRFGQFKSDFESDQLPKAIQLRVKNSHGNVSIERGDPTSH